MRELEYISDDFVHVDEIAREHRMLISLMERLYQRSRAGTEHREIAEILRELEARTIEHFRSEEVYLASIGYSALAPHQRVHRHLLDGLARQRCAFDRGGGSPALAKLVCFLRNWLEPHVADSQRKHEGFAAMKRGALLDA
jgi:hemerythrin-like metal-binding protein